MTDRTNVSQLAGPAEIEAALRGGEPVRLLLYERGSTDPGVTGVVERARRAGIRARPTSAGVLWRISRVRPAAKVLALVGQRPEPTLEALLGGGGAVWLLVGIAYPGNAGFALRTAEVSGADGVVVDSSFDHRAKRQCLRASMRADWYMPVVWAGWKETLARARATGTGVIGIEDVGRKTPWEVDLTRPLLFVVGAEDEGVPPELLDQCDETIRIPMEGFIRSYNLQVAVAVVAAERLRQLRS